MASIIDGLFAGRSGLQGHGQAISVLADNIANSNTTGFKASRADFSSLLAGAISGGGSSDITVGSGSQINAVTQLFNQGTFENTGRSLDLAIQGNGFFVLEDTVGQRFYSRAGNLKTDKSGYLLDQNGYYVMGYPAGGTGQLDRLNVNERSLSTVSTTAINVSGNLNAAATVTAVPAAGSTLAQVLAAASYSTTVDVFDSLGAQHTVTLGFFRTGAGAPSTWAVRAYVDASETGGVAGVASQILTSTFDMTFGNTGVRTNAVAGTADGQITASWASGATSTIDLDMDNFTQFASPNNIQQIDQDGTGGGSVVSFQVQDDGSLSALLDNGQRATIGTITLASFSNPEGLGRRTGTILVETNASGEPVIGTPGTGQFGGLQGEALELSTADLASDFIKLISLQRGFQGSSRMITSINDLLNEVMSIAR